MTTNIQQLAAICTEYGGIDTEIIPYTRPYRYTDYILITSVNSVQQMRSVEKNLHNFLRKTALAPATRMSKADRSGWVIIDCGEIIVHIMTKEMRHYYDLDALYRPSSHRHNAAESSNDAHAD